MGVARGVVRLAPGVPIVSGLGRAREAPRGMAEPGGYEISVGDLEWALWIMPI